MESSFYQNYKRKFFIGLGALLALTCLALAKYNTFLGVFGFVTLLAGLFAFNYVDKHERIARERELREEFQSMGIEEQLEEEKPDFGLALAFLQIDDYDEVFQGLAGEHVPVTMSIGAAKGVEAGNSVMLGRLAQQALELSLERGGDQAVVKSAEHTWFYGGDTEVVGKRSKVRVRVAAAELSRLIKQVNNVVITGHSGMDFDVLGAAMGCAEIVRHYDKKVQILVDHPGGAVDKLADLINERVPGLICTKDSPEIEVSSQTLLLLVDVHRPQMLVEPSLLKRAGYIGVIDHHRRGEEFPERCNLSYIMPGASSTSEMVGELAHYFNDARFSSLAATALLIGIIVDTKRFAFSTSGRTFRIAAQLKEAGADQRLITEMFTDSLEVMLYRARILENAELVFQRFAVAGHDEPMGEARIAASRAADTMLEIAGAAASFAFYPIDGGVGVSARSAGGINVQRIMEKIGGGGHFSVAAAQLKDVTMKDARSRLLEILEDVQEEGEQKQ